MSKRKLKLLIGVVKSVPREFTTKQRCWRGNILYIYVFFHFHATILVGHYIPPIAKLVHEDPSIKLGGVAIGNGWVNPKGINSPSTNKILKYFGICYLSSFENEATTFFVLLF